MSASKRRLWGALAAVVALLLCVAYSQASAASGGIPGTPTKAGEVLTRSFPGAEASAAQERARSWRRRKSTPGISPTRSTSKPYWACPEEACQAIIDPSPVAAGARKDRVGRPARFSLPAGPLLEGSGEEGGLDPQDLQSAYNIPTAGGEDQTVALVDATGYPEAERNLAVYRERYGLPPCTTADHCFRKVNQTGEEGHYPAPSEGWETESALDLDMVSAACPHCHILLVEATSAERQLLAEAVNEAAHLGATEISNSWGNAEQTCGTSRCEPEAKDFDHPGILITAAGGDSGYDDAGEGATSPEYPASLPTVVAVGGTVLHRAADARGWSEEAWPDGGSGCSKFAKPEWQTDAGCSGRMTTDVAAVGGCESPLSVYNVHGWANVCGTSASTPLVAAIEAHAPAFSRSLPGGEAFYEDPGALFDITKGINGQCTPPHEDGYYCHAGVGFDGPTGNGTPDGPLQLTGSGAPTATSGAPSAVTTGAATLNGTVVPNGLETAYHFEYGPTSSYGTSVPVPDEPIGTTGRRVSQSITGLESEHVYHYRLVASSSAGTSYGADEVFTTGVPSVTSVSPATGADGGDTSVTIEGTNFVGAESVMFGTREAASFTVNSETSISAVSPSGAGEADVAVRSPAGTSLPGSGDRFSYNRPGPVLAWGRNRGMLGNGGTEQSDVPGEVASLPEAVSLSTGLTQSLAVLRGGRVMAWGRNSYGTVGNGTYQIESFPVGVCASGVSECPNGPYLEEATQVAAGGLQSLALLRNGTVMAWGGNLYGAIGGSSERSALPLPVCTTLESPCQPQNYLKEVVAVAAGATFSLALLHDGTVVSWGGNSDGQLGLGTGSGPETCDEAQLQCSRVPVPVAGLGSVSSIAAGWSDGFAVLANGTAMSWGENLLGELGLGSKAEFIPTPTAVCAIGSCKKHLTNVRTIAGASGDGFALLSSGTVASWGNNDDGQLGAGTPGGPSTCTVKLEEITLKFPCSREPVSVRGLQEVSAIASGVAAGNTLAQLGDGQFVAWGSGAYGVLGDDATANSESPVGVCPSYAEAACPSGPYLSGPLDAMAAGDADLVGLAPSAGPVVTGLQPNVGPAAGGTSVLIHGTGFTGASAVDFGGTPASEFQVLSADQIAAVAPPGSGSVEVTIVTPEGVSTPSPTDHYIYQSGPTVLTGGAEAVMRSSATLTASVNPDDETVSSCLFEYGTSPGYGSTAPCSPSPGSGSAAVAVSATLAGLQPSSTYYYRAVATNALGTSDGAAQTFTTKQLPEAGRCLKQAGAPTSRYASSACTTLSGGEDSGHYEWQPAAAHTIKLSGSAPAAVFESVGTVRKERIDFVSIECGATAIAGEFESPDVASLSLTMAGCHAGMGLFGGKCNTPGAGEGEFKIGPVAAQLGIIEAGASPSVGLALNEPSPSTPLLQPECDKVPLAITGSVIATLTKADKMTSSFKLKFSGPLGLQSPARFEAGLEDTLTLLEKETSLTSSLTLAGAEAFEVKATG